MLLRARKNTPIATNLTPPIPPIAASLHDKHLLSHCSSCFLPLPSTNPNPLSCPSCLSLRYCSPTCFSSDSSSHLSSAECLLLLLHPPSPSSHIRAALRLLSSSPSSSRIRGLIASGLDEVEGGELAERVCEWAGLMARVRGSGIGVEEALWAVMVNGVEVEDAELGGIGVAVYGPWFSWANHSCAPNACYRFEVGLGGGGLGGFGVLPGGGNGEAFDVVNKMVLHVY